MKSQTDIRKECGGPGLRPKHRRMAHTDEVRACRKAERQALDRAVAEELEEVRGTPHDPNAKQRRRTAWQIANRPQFMEVYDGTSDYLVECDVMEKLTGVQAPYYAKRKAS